MRRELAPFRGQRSATLATIRLARLLWHAGATLGARGRCGGVCGHCIRENLHGKVYDGGACGSGNGRASGDVTCYIVREANSKQNAWTWRTERWGELRAGVMSPRVG